MVTGTVIEGTGLVKFILALHSWPFNNSEITIIESRLTFIDQCNLDM